MNPVGVFDICLEMGSDCAISVTQLLKVLHKIHNSLWQTSVTERTLKRFVTICASLTRKFWRPKVHKLLAIFTPTSQGIQMEILAEKREEFQTAGYGVF